MIQDELCNLRYPYISKPTSFTPIWTPGDYTIQYHETNGGVFGSAVVNQFTYGDILSLPQPTWAGKVFEGWYDNALLIDWVALTQIKFQRTITVGSNLYAKWSGVVTYRSPSNAGLQWPHLPSGSIHL